MKETKNDKSACETAHFRFGLIAPVIQGTYPDESRAEYCRRITQAPLTLPDGSVIRYQPKTVEKWISLYQKEGMDGLMPKVRSDKGDTRVLTQESIKEIHRLKEKYPRLNATQIHQRLIEQGMIRATISVASVQRFIKRNDLKGARNPACKDRKAFEEEYFGGMWQADTCYLPYITENGRQRRTYLLLILDDHSRMIVGAKIFYQDNGFHFQKVLKDAVSVYGIPNKLYVDNGAPYSNEQLSMICGSIGTVLLHTPVRDGASKGKVERNFRTLKERWLYGIDVSKITSLEEFNRELSAYVRRHNVTCHGGTGDIPLERWRKTNERIRPIKSREWLDECFQNRISRKVGKDATLTIDGISYDSPMQFISTRVEIRFLPDRMEDAYILHEGGHYPLRKTNRVENGQTKRHNQAAIDYRMGGCEHV